MNSILVNKIQSTLTPLKPIKDVALFLFLFLLFEFLWKLCVHLGTDGESFIVLGKDLTLYIEPICRFDAKIVYYIIHDLLGYQNFHINGKIVYFENALKLNIIWTCTSIKQLLMFSFIMIFYLGPTRKKLIFTPIALIFLSFSNIIRLVISSLLLKNGFPEWFIPVNEILNDTTWENTQSCYMKFYIDWYKFFHDGIFNWIYYDGIMLLIWLLWQEKFNKPYQHQKIQDS